ncbi:MAG: dephospho-CoA kinase [Planctomycetota bacterium]
MNPPSQTGPVVIGLVGGVGAGKSTVAALLVELGCGLIDGDALGYEVLATDQVRSALVGRWGRRILDGREQVNRRAVAEIVFNAPAELAALNRITAPRIRTRIEQRLAALAGAGTPMAVLDAAILFEAGWDDL